MRTKIYGTDLAKLEGWIENGFVNLRTEFHEAESEYISFPVEALSNIIAFLTSQSAKPGQASYPVPCPVDANTPPNSRQPGAKDSEVLNECDPEGMKPKSKYEKADTVRKYVLGENFRDLKE